MAQWQTLGTKIVYKNKWIQVDEDDVIDPLGDKTIYGIVKPQSGVVYIVPVTADGEFVLTRQYRYAMKEETWEFPSGQTNNEDIISAAKRELHEETGYQSNDLSKISKIAIDTSLSSTRIDIILAKDAIKYSSDLDPLDGIVEAKTFKQETIKDMVLSSQIICPHTIASFYIAKTHLSA
jgi:ADP-ribose pyrophosphatase